LDTKNFFTRVFAQSDELVISTMRDSIFWNRGSYSDIDDAVRMAQLWDNEPNTTVYYSVGAFAGHHVVVDGKPKIQRKQEQARWFKTLAVDLDIGPDKPYQSQREGFAALNAAIKAIGLPAPMVVKSGNGLHIYWTLTYSIPTAAWEKVSKCLRIALQEHGVEIDTSKIHDPSMVLRPVGTHHKKQTPWKEVTCLHESQDYEITDLIKILKYWVDKAVAVPASKKANGKPKSSIAAAILGGNDVDILLVASNCKQIAALVNSGGAEDAAGRHVEEPLWRASLGLAKHAIDVEVAVEMLAGGHPDYDFDTNMSKISGWKGSGPTTCAEFEKHCPAGCSGCPYKGGITSPAQLSVTREVEAPPSAVAFVAATQAPVLNTVQLPTGYALNSKDQLCREVIDENGNTMLEPFCDFPMHVTGLFNDPASGKSAFTLAIKFPHTGWVEQDHEVSEIAGPGKDFATMLANRQVFIKNPGGQDKVRGYIMDYLSHVQSMAPSGVDFIAFGWQADGSFLCGEKLINAPTGNTDMRLRGAASRFAEVIKPHGSRDAWIDGMKMLNSPGTQTIRSAVLIATAGILGQAAGNASMVLSIYSTETTTGKTLALIAANSLIGSPKKLFMNKNDTPNALFKMRGVLNNLPCTIDELTAASDQDIVNLAYDFSQGREKLAMTRDRDIREPVTWDGPTLITTNISLHQKFDAAQSNSDPLKARTMELGHHDRTFIQSNDVGSSQGYKFFDIMAENNGWAFPELAQAVVDNGGAKLVWEHGEAAFMRKFNFIFEPQERFYRTAIIAGWVMGKLGSKLGLFPFDIDATASYLMQQVVSFRKEAADAKQDAFDIIGQFLQEHNDQLIEVTEVYGSGKEQPRLPTPERAVARIKVVYDANTMVLPGSLIYLNYTAFRKWLSRTRDGVDRVVRELQLAGGLISPRERVTLFKGCPNRNPGQAQCVVVNLNHPRFVNALTGVNAKAQSPITLAVLQGNAHP
jgi:hypothetical protein